MSDNAWGNLGRQVAWRDEPHRSGIIVSDYGMLVDVAEAEDGQPTFVAIRDLVGIGSEAHQKALGGQPMTEREAE